MSEICTTCNRRYAHPPSSECSDCSRYPSIFLGHHPVRGPEFTFVYKKQPRTSPDESPMIKSRPVCSGCEERLAYHPPDDPFECHRCYIHDSECKGCDLKHFHLSMIPVPAFEWTVDWYLVYLFLRIHYIKKLNRWRHWKIEYLFFIFYSTTYHGKCWHNILSYDPM